MENTQSNNIFEYSFQPVMEQSIFGIRIYNPLSQLSIASPITDSELTITQDKTNEEDCSPTEISFRQLVPSHKILERYLH